MKYVSYVTYTADKAKIAVLRPQHREYLSRLFSERKLVAAGPFTDDSGALFVYEADSAEAASALVAEDPFSINGVFQRFELKPWKLVFANTELLPTSG
jgi:uncharacterized protein YciI